MNRFDLTYLSFGAGVQSTALLVLANDGDPAVPLLDVAIFADTGDEPAWVYENLDRLRSWSRVPVEIVSAGCISEDTKGRRRSASIPAFTRGSNGVVAPLRRQCTREYKIEPIHKKVRELLGLRPRQRAAGKFNVRCLIGFSLDEVSRCAPSRKSWITNEFPLIDARLDRGQCARIVERAGFEVPGKSSCVFCPYHSDRYWRRLRDKYPAEYAKAVDLDRRIRDMSMSGVKLPAYLHRSLAPLDQVDFRGEGQQEMFDEECAGVCGV